LTDTALIWARMIAPTAEWITQQIWASIRKRTSKALPPTRLTQSHKRLSSGSSETTERLRVPTFENSCRGCGKTIRAGRLHCTECFADKAAEQMRMAAKLGRVAALSPAARAKHKASRRRDAKAISEWD